MWGSQITFGYFPGNSKIILDFRYFPGNSKIFLDFGYFPVNSVTKFKDYSRFWLFSW